MVIVEFAGRGQTPRPDQSSPFRGSLGPLGRSTVHYWEGELLLVDPR